MGCYMGGIRRLPASTPSSSINTRRSEIATLTVSGAGRGFFELLGHVTPRRALAPILWQMTHERAHVIKRGQIHDLRDC